MNLRIVLPVAVVGLLILTTILVYIYRRYPKATTLQALLPAITVTAGLATILSLFGLITLLDAPPQQVHVATLPSVTEIATTAVPAPSVLTDTAHSQEQEQSTEVVEIVDLETNANVATVVVQTLVAIQPTPVTVGEPIYFQSLGSASDASWRVWGDANGNATYENSGYVVRSKDNVSSWLSANLDDIYRDYVLQVDVMPVTFDLVTGYSIAVGWEESNSYYMFVVTPEGKCGVGIIVEQIGSTNRNAECPKPLQDTIARVRLEIDNRQMRAFVDEQYINTWQLPKYEGGKIGLGVHNGGLAGSGVEAGVRFSNLIIWNLP